MGTVLIKKFLPRFLFVGVLALALTPLLTYAADFVPLAPIPNLDTSENATIGSYVNSVFLLVISVAAMLAVIRIVIGGFQYMTQTASVTKTASAVNTIRDAVIGLLLLLGSFVILSTVNEQILSLDALNFTKLGPSQAVQDAIKNADEAALARQKEVAEGAQNFSKNFQTTDYAGIVVTESVADGTNLTGSEIKQYLSACTQNNPGATATQKRARVCKTSSGSEVSRVGAFVCNPGEEYTGKTKTFLYCTKPDGG